MSPHTYICCSFALTFGIPMAIAVREYWTLTPGTGHLPPREPAMPEPSPLPDAGAKPVFATQKPLPACLIPQTMPARVRELA
jgi:hypothetical protein